MENGIKSMKLSIMEIIYTEMISCDIKSSLYFIIKKIILNDPYFSKFSPYLTFITENALLLLNSVLLCKANSTIEEILLSYMKIYTNSALPISNKHFKLSLYIIVNALISIIHTFFDKDGIFRKCFNLTTIVFKFMFLINKEFVYSNPVDYLFGLMKVNKGTTNNKVKIILFLVYLVFNYGGKIYSVNNENKEEEILDIPPPEKKCSKDIKGKCFVCLKKFEVPTVMKCCGYVYCYKCAVDNCLNNGNMKCFSCGLRINSHYLIKIYGY